jgi:Threonine dehydrogenase and related Zn-dependent dehydrogenases
MKALVLEGIQKVSYKDVPTPECPHDGLLIKMDSVGLCGSDVRTYFHGHQSVKYPCILGHENAGTIVEVGSDVKGYAVNEKVIVNPVVPCGKCSYCLKGLQNMCSDRLTYGHHIQGGFAEYMVVPGIGLEKGQVLKIPAGVSTDEIVIAELLSTVVSAQDYANVTLGETVVIIGAGPIGCLHSEVARLRGAEKIIMVNRSQERLEMSKRFSGTHFINSSKENAVERVKEITDGLGADIVIVAAPSVEAEEEGLNMLRKRGRLVIFGGTPKDNSIAKFDSNKIHYNEIAILGTFSTNPTDFKKAFDLVVNRMIKTEGFVTHILPLEKMEEGVREIQSGRALKVVLKP